MSLVYASALIALGLIPSFAWLFFYTREDLRHPEPKKILLLSFLSGGVVTFLVLPIQIFLNKNLPQIGIVNYSFLSFLFIGAIEEIFKFLAVYIFIHRRREFDEPLHAMIYMITAALGFAAVENVASLFQASQGSILNIAIAESLTLRFIGATLLHTLSSGFVGYYWSLAFVKGATGFSLRHERELHPIIKGLLIATVLHAIFNYLIIKTGPATLAIVYVVFAALFLLGDFEKLKKEDI